MLNLLIEFILHIFSIITMIIFPFILMSIIRVYFIKIFLPNYNYDQQFLDYSISNQNYSYILITTKLKNRNDFKIVKDYYINCLNKYLNKNNNKLPGIDFSIKKIISKEINSVNEIIFDDIDIDKALNTFDLSIKMILDNKNNICYVLLSHVFHSGLSIVNDIIYNCQYNTTHLPPSPKYFPIYNEILFLEFVANYLYFSKDKQIPKLITNQRDKNRTLPNKNLIISDCNLDNLLKYKKKINQQNKIKTPFIVYPLAKVCYLLYHTLFLDIKKNKKYFNVVLLVGFSDTDNINIKNNFSFINLNIPTHKIPNLSFNNNLQDIKLLDDFILILYKEINRRKTDAMVSYNLLNYYYSIINNNSQVSDSLIDLNFSAIPELKIDQHNNISTELLINTHVQPINLSTPFYTFTYSLNGKSKISYTINTDCIDFDSLKTLDDKFLKLFY